MTFMRGLMPVRRTFNYLKQGRLLLRNEVKVVIIGFNRRPIEREVGLRDFIFWHFAQLQYQNPHIQIVKHHDFRVTPFILAFLEDGKEILFDLEGMTKDEIVATILKTLGRTKLVEKLENLEQLSMTKNPADFGTHCERQCICEVQGQVPCTSLISAPEYMKGRWRWNHKIL